MKDGIEINDWVNKYSNYLYRYAYPRINDQSAVEDLIQETFMAAIKAGDAFKGDSSVKTWLTSILKHKIYDFYRKKSRNMEQQVESEPEIDAFFNKKGHWQVPVPDWGKSPENTLNDKEFMSVLKKCIEGLKELQKRVFQMREMDGLTNDEICNILNITATNLGVVLYRARNRLRQCLTINWFKGE